MSARLAETCPTDCHHTTRPLFLQVYLRELLQPGPNTSDPQPLLTAPLMDATERQLVLRDFNATDLDYDNQAFVHGLFMQRAKETPNAPCVVYEDYSFTYAEVGRLPTSPKNVI